MQMQSLAVGALVIVLAGGAAFLGAKVAIPAAEPVETPRSSSDPDVLARLDEIERQLEYLGRRIDNAERIAGMARDAADAARPVDPPPARADGTPVNGGRAARPVAPAPTSAGDSGTPPAADLTDAERHERRLKEIHDTIRVHARTMVPEILRKLADPDPKSAEARRLDARIAAQQMAVTIALDEESADKIRDIYIAQADRLAAEVGPLVRDGLDKADISAVSAKLEDVWGGVDREAREALGETRFAKFQENAGSMRRLIREVLAERRK